MNKIPKDWRYKYFAEKIENANSDEIVNAFDNILRFSSGDLRKDTIDLKEIYYQSYSNYAQYYHNIGQNKLALDSITLARKFQKPKSDLLRIAYNSLKFTTPEATYIPILEDLTEDIEFQEFALNSLIPMYESLGDWNNALKKYNPTRTILQKFQFTGVSQRNGTCKSKALYQFRKLEGSGANRVCKTQRIPGFCYMGKIKS